MREDRTSSVQVVDGGEISLLFTKAPPERGASFILSQREPGILGGVAGLF